MQSGDGYVREHLKHIILMYNFYILIDWPITVCAGSVPWARLSHPVSVSSPESPSSGYSWLLNTPTALGLPHQVRHVYSGTSEQRTNWGRAFCPIFRGCPFFGGSNLWTI